MVPDKWYSSYHYSHPPLIERLRAIKLFIENSSSKNFGDTKKINNYSKFFNLKKKKKCNQNKIWYYWRMNDFLYSYYLKKKKKKNLQKLKKKFRKTPIRKICALKKIINK